MEWKDVVRGVAPTLVGALGTPAAGVATKILVDAVLGTEASDDPVENEARVAGVLANGLTPGLRAKIAEADAQYKLEVLRATTRARELDVEVEKAVLVDVDSARHAHSQNLGVLRLGYLINAASYLCVAGVLYGCFRLLGSEGGVKVDPGTAAMLGGIVGAAVQWLLSNAAQANGFFFGSSPGSRQAAGDMAAAVKAAVSK